MTATKEFAIFKNVFASNFTLKISEQDFDQIRKARDTCRFALDLEENFYVVCEAYRELELATLAMSLNAMVYGIVSSDDFQLQRVTLSQRLVALLSAVRLYTDSVKSICKKITGNPETQAAVKKIFSDKYDKSLDFRLFEALRNYVQHSALPVDSIATRCKANADFSAIANFTEFFVSIEELDKDKKFKPKTLVELQKLLEAGKSKKTKSQQKKEDLVFNLKNGARIYFSHLRDCHGQLQSLTDSALGQAEMTLKSFLVKWEELNTEKELNSRHVVATRMQGESRHPEAKDIYLYLDADGLRKKLRQMNTAKKDIHKNYIQY